MRDVRLIHSAEDVPAVLAIAHELGLTIRMDRPTDDPAPSILTSEQARSLEAGAFQLFRDDWVFGPFQFHEIPSGVNRGRYFQSPATNYVGISFFACGERDEDGVHRLGSGSLSRDVDWYRPSDHTVHPAPDEVETIQRALYERLNTSRRLRGGGQSFVVLKGALAKLEKGHGVPPFDYIRYPSTRA